MSALTEHVRARLARQICGALRAADGATPIVTLSPDWERAFADSVLGDGDDRQLVMAPTSLREFVSEALSRLEEAAAAGHAAALVTSANIRPFVRSVIERVRPQTMVLSQNEIHPQAKLVNLGQV